MAIEYDFEYVLGLPRLVTLEMAHAALEKGLLVEEPYGAAWRLWSDHGRMATVRVIRPKYYTPSDQDLKEIGEYIDSQPWPDQK